MYVCVLYCCISASLLRDVYWPMSCTAGLGETDRIIMMDEVEMRQAMTTLEVSDALRFISDRAVLHKGAVNGLLSMVTVARHHVVVARLLTTLERLLDQGVRVRKGFGCWPMGLLTVSVVGLCCACCAVKCPHYALRSTRFVIFL